MNKQNKGNKLIDTDNSMTVAEREGGWGRIKRVKGVKYTVMEGDQTLGNEHTMQYIDDAL